MPFTFSHPAIVLPFNILPKARRSMTGLIMGSMMPDFEYFLRMDVLSLYAHTWLGVLWFNLPLAIIFSFVFHLFVRDGLIDNLPTWFQKRLLRYKQLNWTAHFKSNTLIILLSMIVGAASHLFWDSFTHANGIFVDLIPFLRTRYSMLGYTYPLFRFLQHFCTLIGGIIILLFINSLPKTIQSANTSSMFRYWASTFVVMMLVVLLRFFNHPLTKDYEVIIVSTITGFFIGLIFSSLTVKRR